MTLEAEYLNLNLISITKYPHKLSDYPTPQKLQTGAWGKLTPQHKYNWDLPNAYVVSKEYVIEYIRRSILNYKVL